MLLTHLGCQVARMDNHPAHSMKLWTALRVRWLTTLEADALRLPEAVLIKRSLNSPDLRLGVGGREGASWASLTLPARRAPEVTHPARDVPSVGRSLTWAWDAPERPRSRVHRSGLPTVAAIGPLGGALGWFPL